MGLRTWLGLKARRATPPVIRVDVGDYESYRRTQNDGNFRKIDRVFVREPNISFIADYAARQTGPAPRILCHGTRNGAELRYFKSALPDCMILGTDIADSATRFPDTIQWDFHDIKDEWVGVWDVIYSNSWDHAFEPERAFLNWMRCLSPRGLLFIEHTKEHTAAFSSELDPFGANLAPLVEILNKVGAPTYGVSAILEDLPERPLEHRVVVVQPKIHA